MWPKSRVLALRAIIALRGRTRDFGHILAVPLFLKWKLHPLNQVRRQRSILRLCSKHTKVPKSVVSKTFGSVSDIWWLILDFISNRGSIKLIEKISKHLWCYRRPQSPYSRQNSIITHCALWRQPGFLFWQFLLLAMVWGGNLTAAFPAKLWHCFLKAVSEASFTNDDEIPSPYCP